MDAEPHLSNFLDAHARVREARGKFLQYAEFRYRQFLSDPEQKPHAVVCVHFNDWIPCRDRFGFAGLEALNHQIERRVIPRLGRKDICARFGDAALLMVVAIDSEKRDIETWTRDLLKALSDEPLNVGQPLHVTFSIGLCWFDRRVRSAEEAMFDAMHLSELLANRHENAFRIFRPKKQVSDTRDGENVVERIRSSLQTNHMRLTFQPLLASDDSGLQYLQVWSRLLTEDGGDVRARGFIDVARRNGLLARLDRWTLRRTVRVLVMDRRAPERTRLFVNIALDTIDERTLDWLERTFDQHPHCRHCLIAELDEFECSSRPGLAERVCDQLRELGFGLGLSQIGAENLARASDHLQRFAYLRMSARFSIEMEQDPSLAGSFSELIQRAHEHGVRVVMPSLEDESALVEFWKLGVDLVQGDYIEHPRTLITISDPEASPA